MAYYILKSGQQATTVELKDHLRQALPYYMIPQNFVALDAMPQTNNGKIDYNALPAPKVEVKDAGVADQDLAAPKTPAEKFLAGVWAEALETDQIDLNDNFFDIGGHSLLVMRVIAAVKEETGYTLGPQDFLIGTLEQLADKFADQYSAGDAGPVETETTQQANEIQSACVQQPAEPTHSCTKPAAELSQSESDTDADGAAEGVEKNILKTLKGFWNR